MAAADWPACSLRHERAHLACSCNGSLYCVRNTYLLHSHHRTLTFTTARHTRGWAGGVRRMSERVCTPHPTDPCTQNHTQQRAGDKHNTMKRHFPNIWRLWDNVHAVHVRVAQTQKLSCNLHPLIFRHTHALSETSKPRTHSKKHAISPLTKGHICNAGDSSRRQQVIGWRDRER